MTREEFETIRLDWSASGKPLKTYLKEKVIPYTTYHYWQRKLKAEAEYLPIAPISIRHEYRENAENVPMAGVELPGVTVAFPNGVRAHFGSGSERMLLEVLTQSMHGNVLS